MPQFGGQSHEQQGSANQQTSPQGAGGMLQADEGPGQTGADYDTDGDYAAQIRGRAGVRESQCKGTQANSTRRRVEPEPQNRLVPSSEVRA